jgi:hypothetical protein
MTKTVAIITLRKGTDTSFMKRNALILSTGLMLLTASVAAHAQESGRLSADYSKQAIPLIHWPLGLEPRNVDVFVHNRSSGTSSEP